jgi:penicillin amidase
MACSRFAPVLGLVALGLLGCGDDPAAPPPSRLLGVPESEHWVLPELSAPVEVIRTEGNIPHIYAHNRRDLAIVLGFVTARDRFFMMDLARRLGRGTLTELLGDAALTTDQETRGIGRAWVGEQMTQGLTPELADYADAFTLGINRYIEEVRVNNLPPPTEMRLAKLLLGAIHESDLMKPFAREDVGAMLSVILYNSSYETGDVGRAATVMALPTLFQDQPLSYLRRPGAREDLWRAIEPIKPFASAPGLGTFTERSAGRAEPRLPSDAVTPLGSVPRVEAGLLARMVSRYQKLAKKLNRDADAGFGSNAWAVAGSHTTDGFSLLAGDGHLSLSVPSILFHLGLDTQELGGGDIHQLGMTIPGLPLMAIGTNGQVAWSQTQLMGDITDWYREVVELDGSGVPVRALFRDEWKDLTVIDESYVVADVPALESVGRTETWQRWVTFDGRWIADIEGREAMPGEPLAPGEALVNLQGQHVVPADIDDDGIITAVSFDYVGFDAGTLFGGPDALGHSANVEEFRQAMRRLIGYSQNFTVADADGNVLYSSYQTVPCRAHLDRLPDGRFAEGADPTILIDGTRFGSFRIPIVDGVADEAQGESDPSACVVPFDATPMSINPTSGFVVTANNDPAGLSFDGSLTNDSWYIGGPWDGGFRADIIAREIETAIAEGAADLERMQLIQGDHSSPLGALFTEQFLASIDYARGLPASPTDPADVAIAALYAADGSAMDEVATRLMGWRDRGYRARSGVETSYGPEVTSDDREDAVATMIFNAWMSRVLIGVFDDEGLPGVFQPSGSTGRVRALDRFLRGRGADNPLDLVSFNPARGETAFFDVLATPQIETSHQVIVTALADTLGYLSSTRTEEEDPGTGGFGTDDMSQWLWGLRHYAQFESLLGEFLGEDETFGALTAQFAITTEQIPLAPGLGADDPRAELKWFPRPGDQFGVDAGNPGTSGTSFGYGSGPVMRMVIALKDGQVRAQNVIPGGQSSLTDSAYFHDQAELWLGNKTYPMRFSVDEVIAAEGALRESFTPQ